MSALIGWTKRIALAAVVVTLFYVVADHAVNRDRISLGGENSAWTFGAAPSNGAGAEVCTYFSPAPSALTTQQLGQVRCDANQTLMVDVAEPPRTILVPAAGTAPATLTGCASSNNLVNGPVILVTLIHEGVAAEGSGTALSVYDEGSSPSCSANDLIFIADQLGATQFPALFNVYLKNGLTYKWQATPTSGVRFGYIVP